MTEVSCIFPAGARVAESPVWCVEERALYWTDIYAPAVCRLDPETGANTRWLMPAAVGSIALRRAGGIVAAGAGGFYFLDPETGAVETLHDPEPDRPSNRLNDGRCDRRGRFWAGSMDESLRAATGALYRFDPDRRCHRMVDDLIVSNGLAFSPDDRVLYHADTRRFAVYAYDFDVETAAIANKRVFFETADGEGRPDGAAVDAEGCYWSARYDGWGVVRHDPAGRVMSRIDIPVAAATCAPSAARIWIVSTSPPPPSASTGRRSPASPAPAASSLPIRGCAGFPSRALPDRVAPGPWGPSF